jgi:hypothetical protein
MSETHESRSVELDARLEGSVAPATELPAGPPPPSSGTDVGRGGPTALLRAILEADVRSRPGHRMTVRMILNDPNTYAGYQDLLLQRGIEVRRGNNDPRRRYEGDPVGKPQWHYGPSRSLYWGDRPVCFDAEMVLATLLWEREWWDYSGEDCQDLLLRLPNARRKKRCMGRRQVWAVVMPLELVFRSAGQEG